MSESKRRSQGGATTSDLILSATIGKNAPAFADILRLHVPVGSTIADVTYGKGAFWRHVEPDAYRLLPSDLKTGVDCRELPHADQSIDCVVLDPPYMEGFYRTSAKAGTGSHAALSLNYSHGSEESAEGGPKYQAAVLDFYIKACDEAIRVLRPGGVLIVKCQDAVSAGRQHMTHADIITEMRARGLYAKDLFVVVRQNRPAVSRMLKQRHARKSHSYFLVFVTPMERAA